MERVNVISGNINSVGYEESSNTLEIEFKSGSIYQYSNIPQEVYNELLQASSIGRYFIRNIRDTYRSYKIR
jgi:hypothetical protein